MFTLYIFLLGYLLGIVSYVFLVEDTPIEAVSYTHLTLPTKA